MISESSSRVVPVLTNEATDGKDELGKQMPLFNSHVQRAESTSTFSLK